MPFSLDLLRTNSIPSPYLGRFMFGFRQRNPNMKRPRYGDGTAQIRRWVGVKGVKQCHFTTPVKEAMAACRAGCWRFSAAPCGEIACRGWNFGEE